MTNNGRNLKVKDVNILVADDDLEMRSLVSDELKEEGYRVTQAADGEEALRSLEQSPTDMIISDLRMPHGGMAFVARVKATVPRSPVILMTAFGDKETESLAFRWGASAYFNKPLRMAELKKTVKHLLDDDAR